MTAGTFKADLFGDFVGDMFKIRTDKLPGCSLVVTKINVKYVSLEGEFEIGVEKDVSADPEFLIPKKKVEIKTSSTPIKGIVTPPPPTLSAKETLEAKLAEITEADKFFSGQCLSKEDYKEADANKLSCDSMFSDILGNYTYNEEAAITQFPLPQSHLFKCPSGCANKEGLETAGALIHPSTAKICLSAWADRAIDTNGGVIQI
mmetsp:Transcript_18148/g.14803  ORF Transcript_18148/g.14803 Transcript_18148/m.14803 type:complete len:204 (-) Transcript_18148:701-1312(-)